MFILKIENKKLDSEIYKPLGINIDQKLGLNIWNSAKMEKVSTGMYEMNSSKHFLPVTNLRTLCYNID